MSELKVYRVWDAPTRWFHWINAVCVVALVVVGYLILNGRALEIPRTSSLKLKTIHTWVGYVFAANLLLRIVWGFVGNRYARWRAILPGGRGLPGRVPCSRAVVAAAGDARRTILPLGARMNADR